MTLIKLMLRKHPAIPAAFFAATFASMAAAQQQPADCSTCHPELKVYSTSSSGHHPTGRPYPGASNPRYVRPNATQDGVAFFDANHNGALDPEDVRLFGAGLTVECSSCHREHWEGPTTKIGDFLRADNRDSVLCNVCHRL